MRTLATLVLSLVAATALSAAEPKKTIILDPGHEPWSTSHGAPGEPKANLIFAKALEAVIDEHEKYDVIVTVNDIGYDSRVNEFGKVFSYVITSRQKLLKKGKNKNKKKNLPSISQGMSRYDKMLYARGLFFHPEFSPKLNAVAFVSLHYNDTPNYNREGYRGFCVFYKPQEAFGAQSIELAKAIKDALVLHGYAASTNPGEHKGYGEHPKNLIVLVKASMKVPAVLIELGYITHKEDKQEAHDTKKASAKAEIIYRVLDEFLSRRK